VKNHKYTQSSRRVVDFVDFIKLWLKFGLFEINIHKLKQLKDKIQLFYFTRLFSVQEDDLNILFCIS